MLVPHLYIPAIIALLSVGYPIILQVMTRLDEKYASKNILELFEKEREYILFRWSLYVSLIFSLIWLLQLEPKIQINGFDWIINNSALTLISISTFVLIVSFILLIYKVLVYYNPTRLIDYFKKKYSNGKLDYFDALSDILIVTIKNQWDQHYISLMSFFKLAYKEVREKKSDQPVKYPWKFYNTLHRIVEETAISNQRRNNLFTDIADIEWLLGNLEGNEISFDLYNHLWKNFRIMVHYRRGDMIRRYWSSAEQYFSRHFKLVGEYEDSTKEHILKINEQRDQFRILHYAMGGLLLHQNLYNSINDVFNSNVTSSLDRLLPNTMDDIFQMYFDLIDSSNKKYYWLKQLLRFPGDEDILSKEYAKVWTGSFIALLFLRQYKIPFRFITLNPLAPPDLPHRKANLRIWIDYLPQFKSLVERHLENRELLEKVHLTYALSIHREEANRLEPLDFLDAMLERLRNKYHESGQYSELSTSKIQQFKNKSKEILEYILDKLSVLSNKNIDYNNRDVWETSGRKWIINKDPFIEGTDVYTLGFDTDLGNEISISIQKIVSDSFEAKFTQEYTLHPDDIFSGIQKLEINKNYVILAFGINFEHPIKGSWTERLRQTDGAYFFGDVPIYSFPSMDSTRQTLFILKETDLPNVAVKDIPSDALGLASKEKISDKYEIYGDVVDLNRVSSKEKEEMNLDQNKDYGRSALVVLKIDFEISWKKKVDMIRIQLYSDYLPLGIPNKLSDVKSIKSE